jgi:hypothetical protein
MLEEHLPQYFDWIARARKHAGEEASPFVPDSNVTGSPIVETG